jgi:hypothetical protein
MFTTINNYINDSFEVLTTKSKSYILDSADKVIRDPDWLGRSKPPTITDNEISIQRIPTAFNPFKGIGTVRLTISPDSENTKIKCDIYPWNNSFSDIIIVGVGLMTAWTFAGLIIVSTNWDSLVIIGLCWILAIFFTYISVLTNKKILRDYSKTIIKELTK